MKKSLLAHFEPLTFEEILNIQPARYDDYGLLKVSNHFDEEDDERSYAVTELILRSPDHDEMMDYSTLYSDLIDYYLDSSDNLAALRWAYARWVYVEQHALSEDRGACIDQIATAYLANNDLHTGVKLFTRRIQQDPQDLEAYRFFGYALWLEDFNDLALEVVHRGLALTNQANDSDMLEILESLEQDIREEQLEANVIQEVDADLVAEIRTALCLDANPEAQNTWPYLPPVAHLLDPNTATDPALSAEIRLRPQLFAPDLIRLAFDEDLPPGPAVEQAIALLRQMQPALQNEFTEILPWLERADGDWRKELLLPDFGKVGGYSTVELMQFGRDPGNANDFRISAIEALADRLDQYPEQRPIIVAFLREMLTRPDLDQASHEILNSVVISVILKIDARELYPEIKAAFDFDCVDPITITLADVHEEWEMPPVVERLSDETSLNLPVKCLACGRVRKHATRYVLVDLISLDKQKDDPDSRYSSHILDHELICPKCGAHDQYHLTLQAQMMLLISRNPIAALESLSGKKPAKPLQTDPRVFYFKAMALGQEMNPLKAVDEYRWRLLKKPGDAQLHTGFGKLLRLLGRTSQAMEELEFARTLNPSNIDTLINLAMLEHDYGDRERARELYNEIIRLDILNIDLSKLKPPPKTDSNQMPMGYVARDGLDALQSGMPSPWFMPITNADGKALPDFLNEGALEPGASRSQKRRKSRKGK